jgi:hypothetical protein
MVIYTELKSFFPHTVMMAQLAPKSSTVYLDIVQTDPTNDDHLKNLYINYNERVWFTGVTRTADTVIHRL